MGPGLGEAGLETPQGNCEPVPTWAYGVGLWLRPGWRFWSAHSARPRAGSVSALGPPPSSLLLTGATWAAGAGLAVAWWHYLLVSQCHYTQRADGRAEA